MTQPALPAWRWQTHKTIPSTQDAAIAAAEQGDPGRLAIIAEQQESGRGSRGRQWLSPPGNLALSILLRPDAREPHPGSWALLAGIALYDTLAPHTAGLMLKWPNDLLLHGAKLAGILIDSTVAANGKTPWVVIGIGANLATAPAIGNRKTAHLPPPAPLPKDVATTLLDRLDDYDSSSTQAICEAWMARAHPLGTMLDVQLPNRRIQGAFAGLTNLGELLLTGQSQPLSSAEITLA